MDRQEALKLLRGGNYGIMEWNRRRENGERIPDLSGVNLSGLVLTKVNLSEANLSRATIDKAVLHVSNFSKADLSKASLQEAEFDCADFSGANLSGADLGKADFFLADLSEANLSRADALEADFSDANLSSANLSNSNLSRANLVKTNFAGADLTASCVFGTSIWSINLDGATQQNLYINDYNEPVITVDNLELAQFIYLLLDNAKIRDVIDTITSKAVLILGRFTPERKAILDGIREALREHNYLPILFDFDKPSSRDVTETVSTLAHMSRFVIADLTDPKSLPQELMRIVPELPSVPVQPILLQGEREHGMYEHFTRYPWVLPIYQYQDLEHLFLSLRENIITPAEAKVAELQPRSSFMA